MRRTVVLAAFLVACQLPMPDLSGLIPSTSERPDGEAWRAYLAEPFAGEGWTPVDPVTLEDIPGPQLLDLPAPPQGTTPYETLVSADRRTVAVIDWQSRDRRVRMFDGVTGKPRTEFAPEIAAWPQGLSVDGRTLIAFVDDPVAHGAVVTIDTTTGKIIRRLGGADRCCLQRSIPTPTGEVVFLVVPREPRYAGRQSVSVLVRKADGTIRGPVDLPEVLTGPPDTPGSDPAVPARLSPAVAISRDGRTMAIHAADRDLLIVVDLDRLTVASHELWRKHWSLDILRPQLAAAKEFNDMIRWRAVMSPDGRYLYAAGENVRRRESAAIEPVALRRVDLRTGEVIAERTFIAPLYEVQLSPDGRDLYVTSMRDSVTTIERLDAKTLRVRASREFLAWRQIFFVAGPP